MVLLVAGVSTATTTASVANATSETGRWAVVFNTNELPAGVDTLVANAGGTITERIAQIGAVRVESTDSTFASRMAATPGVRAVSADLNFQLIPEDGATALPPPAQPPVEEPNGPAEPPGSDPQPGFDNLYNQQWDKMRMNASATGSYAVQRGRADVVVAVLDTGADVLPAAHPDLAPNLDFARSRSFVGANAPGGDPSPSAWDDRHGHGSWCLSAAGAPINTVGVSGVAPNVRLVALKVLNDFGSGSFLDLAEALIYAGANGFDVASMSLGGFLNHTDFQALHITVQRAVEFARANGVTPIAALGNNNFDLSDGAFMRDFIEVPGEVPGVVGVSATGYFNQKSYYSNYGVGKADVSAPGGDRITQLPPSTLYRGGGRAIGAWAVENFGGVVPTLLEQDCTPTACGTYAWVQGTSMATPNAAGVAALIISQHGTSSSHLAPSAVEAHLQQTANNRPCPQPRTVTYPPTGLPQTASCNGNAGYNGFFGSGIADALKAVTEGPA
ncbi:MAG TPA: S8 family serine peptidase [Pseudonocardiaceae bacterium]|nr:S8 family serine peptidase [Pseudonocardiaceae bacterium]